MHLARVKDTVIENVPVKQQEKKVLTKRTRVFYGGLQRLQECWCDKWHDDVLSGAQDDPSRFQ